MMRVLILFGGLLLILTAGMLRFRHQDLSESLMYYTTDDGLYGIDVDNLRSFRLLQSSSRLNNIYPSPDGLWIYYTAFSSNDGSIYRTCLNGSRTKRITHFTGYEELSGWSPDGERLIFRTIQGVDRNQNFYVANLDGGQVQPLTSLSDAVEFRAWTADDWIIFSDSIYGDGNVYHVRPDGSDLQSLTHESTHDAFVGLTLDEEWIVYASYNYDDYTASIYRIRPDGLEKTVLFETKATIEHTTILPNTSKLLIETFVEDIGLHIVDLKHDDPITTIHMPTNTASHLVSPDEEWIVYQLYESSDIYRLHVDSEISELWFTFSGDTGHVIQTWLPNTNCFTYHELFNSKVVWRACVDNGQVSQNLVSDDGLYRGISPDGEWVIVLRFGEKGNALYRVNISTGESERLSQLIVDGDMYVVAWLAPPNLKWNPVALLAVGLMMTGIGLGRAWLRRNDVRRE